MFEKEAKERAKDIYIHHFDDDVNYPDVLKAITVGVQKGAEFGYNNANEWHYVKEELPELYKDVLVVFPRGDCDVKRLTNHNEWVGRGSWCSLTDVIAWKEIVLPNIKED